MIPSSSNSQIQSESDVQVLSVEQLNRQIRQLIEGQLDLVWVQGELSNFKAHTSGHFYFSLKDAKSQISAVMFRGHNSRLKFRPGDGLQVIVRGRVTVYEPRGNYQIAVEMMEPMGAGALQKAFEQLKVKLKGEGLFDQARKRPLPAFPKHIAIVTSQTGAAIRDMMNVLARRNKSVPVTLIPTLVQGEGAAEKIGQALQMAWKIPDVDVIIIGRGGGSIEDLWAFNDENLARLIAKSPVPVISAVGHEIDFTISDFVADLRAPTPSAAAELVVKNTADLAGSVVTLRRMLLTAMGKHLQKDRQALQSLSHRLVDPKRRLQDLEMRRDELTLRLQNSAIKLFEARKLRIQALRSSLVSPAVVVAKLRAKNEQLHLRMKNQMKICVTKMKSTLHEKMKVLDTLSPLSTVARGYSLTRKEQQLITSIKQVQTGDQLCIRVTDGEIQAQVIKTNGGPDGL